MIKHGEAPFLECSSLGDKRFSALYARIEARGAKTIERIYQAAKVFADGTTNLPVPAAKGKLAVNQEEIAELYEQLWREYLQENPGLIVLLVNQSGLSDAFGQPGHACQATTLWKLRREYLGQVHT